MSAGKRWRKVVKKQNARLQREHEDFAHGALKRRGLDDKKSAAYLLAHETLVWLRTDSTRRRKRLETLAETLQTAGESSVRDPGGRRALLHAAKSLRLEASGSFVPVCVVAVFASFVRREVSEKDRRKRDDQDRLQARNEKIRMEAKQRQKQSPHLSQNRISQDIAVDWDSSKYGDALSWETIKEISFKRRRRR